MQIHFLTPLAERLNADGTFEPVFAGGLLGRLRRPVVLLAREQCTFALFESAALPAGRRRQAARLHASTASPYLISGAALVKSGADFGIWWWDLERVGAQVAGRYRVEPSVRPETLAQPMGSDWRIVRLQNGYEAQLWRAKGLVASIWRKDRFDPASWTRFVRLQRNAPAAPETPPPAQTLPVAPDSEAFSLSLEQVSRQQAIALAAGSFAVVVACAVAFLIGQGLQLADEAKAVEATAAEIRASTPQTRNAAQVEGDRRRLTTYREIENRTNPIGAAGAAIGIVALHDLTPRSVDAQEDVLTLTLPYTAVAKADELIQEFETSGFFEDVEPRTDAVNQTITFEMKILSGAEPLTAGE